MLATRDDRAVQAMEGVEGCPGEVLDTRMRELKERLHVVARGMSMRQLAGVTGHHPESIRRYLNGRSPSAEFLAAVCDRLDVNGDWLLAGRGSMRSSEVRERVLESSGAPELLRALATATERLMSRG